MDRAVVVTSTHARRAQPFRAGPVTRSPSPAVRSLPERWAALARPSDILSLQRRSGNGAVASLLRAPGGAVQRIDVPGLPTSGPPSAEQRRHLKSAVAHALDAIDELIGTAPGHRVLDAAFGAGQRGAAIDTYRQMSGVLARWGDAKDDDRLVTVSGWQERFGRGASTAPPPASTITLPPTAFESTPSDLAPTLVHESAHGASASVLDHAMRGSSGFKTMAGPARLHNAYHFDAAWRAYLYPDPGLMDGEFGNPNVTSDDAAVSAASPKAPVFGQQLERAQSLFLHVRIHAENMLQVLVDHARRDQAPSWVLANTQPLHLPVHDLGFFATKTITLADVARLDLVTQRVTALHRQAGGLTYAVGMSGANACTLAGGQVTFNAKLQPDDWLTAIVDEVLRVYPPGAGLDRDAIMATDALYHKVRGQSGH